MLPEQLHIEQIQRFHKTMSNLKERIESESNKEIKSHLALQYFNLMELWKKVDDFVEFTLKHELDCMEN